MDYQEVLTRSAEETEALGEAIGRLLPADAVVCFFGDLAAGKTMMIRGLARSVTGVADLAVTSPTFVYLNIYDGARPVYHFDVYRLDNPDEFLAMGFDEYFSHGGVCCVEWSERIEEIIPSDVLRVAITHDGEGCRRIILRGALPEKLGVDHGC